MLKKIFQVFHVITVLISVQTLLETTARASIFQISNDFETRSIDATGGYFKQDNGSLLSGGLFWSPEMQFIKLGKSELFLGSRVGAWIFKSRGNTPAFSPSFEVAPRLLLPFYDLSVSGFLGGGYSFVLDRAFLSIGMMVSKTFSKLPLGIRGIGVQYSLIKAQADINFFGVNAMWRW